MRGDLAVQVFPRKILEIDGSIIRNRPFLELELREVDDLHIRDGCHDAIHVAEYELRNQRGVAFWMKPGVEPNSCRTSKIDVPLIFFLRVLHLIRV